MELFDPLKFDGQPLRCTRCGWQGRGDEAIVLDFYGVTAVKQVQCPKCDEVLGNVPTDPDISQTGDSTGLSMG